MKTILKPKLCSSDTRQQIAAEHSKAKYKPDNLVIKKLSECPSLNKMKFKTIKLDINVSNISMTFDARVFENGNTTIENSTKFDNLVFISKQEAETACRNHVSKLYLD